jgi:hypothetical protein
MTKKGHRSHKKDTKLYYAQAFPAALSTTPVAVLAQNVPYIVAVPARIHNPHKTAVTFTISLQSTSNVETNVSYNLTAGTSTVRSLTNGPQSALRLAALAIPAGGAQTIVVTATNVDSLSECGRETYNLTLTNLNAASINLVSYTVTVQA